MTNEELMVSTQRYLMSNYGRLPVALVSGSGATLRDAAGKEYIDLFAGFGAAAIGHCHPAIVSAIQKQAAQLMCVGNLFTWPSQVELAESIIKHSFGNGRVFFCHSGAEANEAALKLAQGRRQGPLQDDQLHALLPRADHGRPVHDQPAQVPRGL